MAVTSLILPALALCSSWHLAHSVRVESTIENTDDVRVRLLLTRHAFSCANAVQEFGESTFERMTLHARMKDPFLTDCGVHRSKEGAKKLLEIDNLHVDLVLSSSLLRAMETARFMYPNHTIVPCPYISEDGIGADNTPRDVQVQLEYLKKKEVVQREGLKADVLDMRWMSSGPFSGPPRTQPKWSDFKTFMAEVLLPGLPAHLHKKDLTIAVVTHSHFLNKIPELASNCKNYFDEKPKNNQIFELNYRFTTKLVVEGADGTGLIPSRLINPFSTTSDTVLEFRTLLGQRNNTDIAFGKILAPNFPTKTSPKTEWTDVNRHGVSLRIERDFGFEPASGCKSLIDVPDKSAELCERDYGKVCVVAHSKKANLKFVESKREEALKEIKKYQTKNPKKAAQAQKQLDELNEFKCCTPQ